MSENRKAKSTTWALTALDAVRGRVEVVRKDAVNVSALTAKAPREVVAEIFCACGRCRRGVSVLIIFRDNMGLN